MASDKQLHSTYPPGDEWDPELWHAEDDEPAPVEVHGVEGRGPHLGRLQVDLIVERLVRGRVLVVAVDDGGLEEPEFFKSNWTGEFVSCYTLSISMFITR